MNQVTKDMNIAAVLEIDPGIANVLFASGMHCIGCMMAAGETLEQAAVVHDINADELIGHINDYLMSK